MTDIEIISINSSAVEFDTNRITTRVIVRIASGPHAGREVVGLYYDDPIFEPYNDIHEYVAKTIQESLDNDEIITLSRYKGPTMEETAAMVRAGKGVIMRDDTEKR
jgi:hypothetical protein